ncbi:DUF6294 family protein [Terriglobus saanensis]|nr:DUF6294 family protein [Terriglobus saanensis]
MSFLSNKRSWLYSVALISLLLPFSVQCQPKPTPQAPVTATATPNPTDLNQCKAGVASACLTYSNALNSACGSAGSPAGQLFCARKASCYSDRSLGLSHGGGDRTPTIESCDAQGIGTDPFPGFVPAWQFHWGDDTNNGKPIRAGDCVLQSGVITIKNTGEIDYEGVTYTNHTSSGDIWHATFHFFDSDGVPLFNSATHDSPRMGDGNGGTVPRYKWNFQENFDKSLFKRIAKVTQTSQC